MRLALLAAFAAAAAGCNNDLRLDCSSWTQWGNNSAHDGNSCIAGQRLGSAQADIVFDPFLPQEEQAAGGDDVLVHFQVPLQADDDVYMMSKSGTFTPCDMTPTGPGSALVSDCTQPDELYRLNTQVWNENGYTWSNGALGLAWTFASDWKPEPTGAGFEPVFQPAVDGDLIAIPGAGGTVWELDRTSGEVVAHVSPFGSGAPDPDTYVSGGIAVAVDGTLYYNALKLDHDAPFASATDAWLVTIPPNGGTPTATDYSALVPGAPAATDLCLGEFAFGVTPLPWPPLPNADGTPLQPPSAPCGSQRPGINSTPAIGADGTIFIVSRAHLSSRYSYLIAVSPDDLTVKWATSLRGLLHDGCGVLIPSDAQPTDTTSVDCRVGSPTGIEPSTNALPDARVDDNSSASPVALPDGGVLYGSYTLYNGFRGHLIHLDSTGAFQNAYDFGWDSMPAVVPTASGSYDIVIKDNHYGQDTNGVDLGPYFITKLSSDLQVRWRFQSTNTQDCTRDGSGAVTCTADHPHGFEWCINAPAIDKAGVIYANSEDGMTYAINADGTLRDSIFNNAAQGAAYTPVALDHNGRVYALNAGHMIALGD